MHGRLALGRRMPRWIALGLPVRFRQVGGHVVGIGRFRIRPDVGQRRFGPLQPLRWVRCHRRSFMAGSAGR
ncbi:hypothetical protein BED46_021765 [Burkholderia contaminans]|uniref:Uncharacterized protein n=1 Tax=Burkholderia contaminans LMG 23361 TaxID=1334628 RepID=A0ABD4AZP6_9BURK|nr:hypothetical protein WR31_12605 [Burkholderia contaminans LMG 23361]ODN28051.1 hypothetical protein BGI28_10185 [Burkholderia contaminans]OMI80838.1 hypothetical protein BED46_021765 [Burkholderia contaminans]